MTTLRTLQLSHEYTYLAALARDGTKVQAIGEIGADDTELLTVADLNL